MRIAQVAPLYESVPPRLYGGTERVVSNLTEELVRQGHDVTLFATGDSITSANLVSQWPQGLRLSPNSVDHLAPHIAMLEDVFASKHNFDVIHFHCDYLHFPWTRRERVASVTTLHGRLDIPELPAIYRAFPEMPVVSISDAQQVHLPWLNWQATVYHGITSKWYCPHRKVEEYLVFLGRISPEKGPVEAIEIARRAGMKIKIAAKVDRADQAFYEAKVQPLLKQPHVEWVGEIRSDEIADLVGGARALLFPINWPEPFGLVMIEAMACGTPVIAFPHGSVPEIIDEGVTGFLASDIDSAVAAIQDVSTLDRQRCFERFLERFSAKRMTDDYLDVYRRIAGEQPESLAFATGASIG